MSASPYQGAASQRFSNRMSMSGRDVTPGAYDSKPKLSNAPTPSTSKSTTPTSDDGMSSTARFILDTLEKMSTPVRDAQKIPLIGRAEKRRQVMSELESSLVQTSGSGAMQSSKRHRPNLSATSTTLSNNRTLLNGPPLRTLVSPVTTPRSRTTAVKSARLAASTPMATSSSSFVSTPALTTNPSTPFSNVSAITSSKAFDTASATTTSLGDSRQPQPAINVNKYQIPFSVPALTGGVATSTSSKREPVKPSAPPSFAPAFSTDQSRSGKIRTKLGEKAIEIEDENSQPEVLPPHLLNPTSSGLELKQMPNFGFFSAPSPNNGSQSTLNPVLNSPGHGGGSTGALSKSSSKTADTVLLSPVRKTVSSFSFSEPEVVSPSSNTGSFSSKMNGENSSARFTFSQPDEIAPSETIRHLNSNNHFVMPDVTSSTFLSSTASNNFSSTKSHLKEMPSVQSLKSGSVMDILGGNQQSCFEYQIFIANVWDLTSHTSVHSGTILLLVSNPSITSRIMEWGNLIYLLNSDFFFPYCFSFARIKEYYYLN